MVNHYQLHEQVEMLRLCTSIANEASFDLIIILIGKKTTWEKSKKELMDFKIKLVNKILNLNNTISIKQAETLCSKIDVSSEEFPVL